MMNFTDLGLSTKTVRAIKDLGISEPTTVQADVIPSILEGRDIFTIAPQGCGKTCSYVFPLVDIIARRGGQTILILTADSETSASISDKIAVFNRYHSERKSDDGSENEANVIIASPDLLLELMAEENIDLAKTSILVVDDINIIKKKKQLKNLEKILELLPAEKQNIVYTNRRSQETKGILEKILKAPQEIKVDKDKEQEANILAPEKTEEEKENSCRSQNNRFEQTRKKQNRSFCDRENTDKEALALIRKYNTFCGKTPSFLTQKGRIINEE